MTRSPYLVDPARPGPCVDCTRRHALLAATVRRAPARRSAPRPGRRSPRRRRRRRRSRRSPRSRTGVLGRREADEPRVRCSPCDLRGAGLARDRTPGICAGVPVPSFTTSTMRSRTVAAVVGCIARLPTRSASIACRGSPRRRCSRRGRARAASSSRRRSRPPARPSPSASGVTATVALADAGCANSGWFCWNVPRVGPDAAHDAGREVGVGGGVLDAEAARCPARTSRRGRGRSARTSCCTTRGTTRASVPPHSLPPKFRSVRSVCGRSSSRSSGTPGCRP